MRFVKHEMVLLLSNQAHLINLQEVAVLANIGESCWSVFSLHGLLTASMDFRIRQAALPLQAQSVVEAVAHEASSRCGFLKCF